MTKTQRALLARLMDVCNSMGSTLDGTATHQTKYIDRQEAHGKVWKVIYGVFGDDPNNEHRKIDITNALKYLDELEATAKKNYPDRNGFTFSDENQ